MRKAADPGGDSTSLTDSDAVADSTKLLKSPWSCCQFAKAARLSCSESAASNARECCMQVAMSGRKRIQQQLDSTSSAVMKSIGNSAHQAS